MSYLMILAPIKALDGSELSARVLLSTCTPLFPSSHTHPLTRTPPPTHAHTCLQEILEHMTRREKWRHIFPKVLEAWESQGFLPMLQGIHPSVEILAKSIFWSNLI